MGKIISLHSFRGGTGKSNITANLSYLLAKAGKKVAVVDTDIQSPGIHVLFKEKEIQGSTLNDFLWGKIEIEKAALDVSSNFELPAEKLHLVPCSMKIGEITKILKNGYDVTVLNRGYQGLLNKLSLDYLVIDTHPGLNEETLLSTAISDQVFFILRPDHQDFQGASVTVDVARTLNVKNISLVLNKLPPGHDKQKIKNQIESTYNCPAAAILNLSSQVVELASEDLFAHRNPDDPWTQEVQKMADQVLSL